MDNEKDRHNFFNGIMDMFRELIIDIHEFGNSLIFDTTDCINILNVPWYKTVHPSTDCVCILNVPWYKTVHPSTDCVCILNVPWYKTVHPSTDCVCILNVPWYKTVHPFSGHNLLFMVEFWNCLVQLIWRAQNSGRYLQGQCHCDKSGSIHGFNLYTCFFMQTVIERFQKKNEDSVQWLPCYKSIKWKEHLGCWAILTFTCIFVSFRRRAR